MFRVRASGYLLSANRSILHTTKRLAVSPFPVFKEYRSVTRSDNCSPDSGVRFPYSSRDEAGGRPGLRSAWLAKKKSRLPSPHRAFQYRDPACRVDTFPRHLEQGVLRLESSLALSGLLVPRRGRHVSKPPPLASTSRLIVASTFCGRSFRIRFSISPAKCEVPKNTWVSPPYGAPVKGVRLLPKNQRKSKDFFPRSSRDKNGRFGGLFFQKTSPKHWVNMLFRAWALLPLVVAEGFVGLRHLVGVLTLLD